MSCNNIGDAEEPDLAVIPGQLDDNADVDSCPDLMFMPINKN